MSGFFKSIGKVFKKVVKVVKKVAPFALVAAAAVFTGGAALGILPSFGTAVGGLVSSLGVGSQLGGLLTGIVTKAGIGGLAGLALGGKKGMKQGLMAGAAMGALGGLSSAAGAAPAASAPVAASAPAAASGAGGWTVPIDGGPMSVPGVAAATPTMTAPAGGGGLMGMMGGGNNQLLLSQAIQGLGSGLMARSQMRAEERAREKEAANYSVAGGLLDPAVMAGQAPAQDGDFDQNKQLKWTYDPRQGKLVRMGA